MPDFWRNIVFVRLLFPLIVGIILFQFLKLGIPIWILIGAAIILILSMLSWKRMRYGKRWLFSLPIFLVMAINGYLLAQLNQPATFSAFKAAEESFVIEITDNGIERERSIKYEGNIVRHPNGSLQNEKLLLYLSIDADPLPDRGDIIAINGYINRISSPSNPHEFNYQRFMDGKGIHFQAYVMENKYKILSIGSTESRNPLLWFRSYASNYLEKHISLKNLPIGKALLIGEKDTLSAETKSAFSRSGTMHILAVSGLHVGIIFLLFNMLLTFLQRNVKFIKSAKPFLLIAIIWFYALMTGGSPSTIRAAIMFTAFTIGWNYFPYVNSLNILAAVAFFMLAFNPQYIFNVGFQLSFAAVAGILLMLPLLKKQWPGGPRVWRYFKDIIFMSIAAQVATLPISIFYFHQLPTLGLLANLYAIPLAFIIVTLGFVGLLFGAVPILSDIMGWLLNVSLSVLQFFNQSISDLDIAIVGDLLLKPFEIFMLYGVIALVLLQIYQKKRWILWASLASLLLFFSSISWNKINSLKQQEFVVYNTSDNIVLEFIDGRESALLFKDSIPESALAYSIKPNQLHHYIKKTEFVQIKDSIQFEKGQFLYKHPLLLIGDQKFIIQEKVTIDSIDYIITSKKPWNLLNTNYIITDQYRFKSDSSENTHYLKSDGAFILKDFN